MLTDDQVREIRDNWDALADRSGELADIFYRRLLTANPTLGQIFSRVDMPRLQQKLAVTLAHVVRSLDQVDELVRLLAPLGRAHVGYGARPEHYPLVREAMLAALGEVLGDDFTDNGRAAWTSALQFMEGVMLDGDTWG